MKTSLIAFAFILFFNPQINVIDIFPDFIGWMLICFSLKRVRHLSFQLENTAHSASKMAWLTFAGFMCILLYPQVDGTMMLTVNFALNVMKLLWGIPAFKYLFDGITELSGLYGGTKIYEPIGISKKESVQSAYKMTLVFYISFCVINALPEFAELSSHSSIIMSEGYRLPITFKPLFYAASFVLTLIIGVVWLCIALPFLRKLNGDKKMIDNVAKAYREKMIETGKHRAVTLVGQFMLAAISGLFIISITFDSVNIIPRFVLPIMILCISLRIGTCGYNTKILSIVSAAASVISAVSYVLRILFAVNYSYDMVTRSFAAYDFYVLNVAALSVELALLIVQQMLFARLLLKVAKNDASREVLAVNAAQIEAQNRINQLAFRKKVVIYVLLFIPAVLLNVGSFVASHIFPVSWIIVLASGIVWLVYSYSFFAGLRDGIENKYL